LKREHSCRKRGEHSANIERRIRAGKARHSKGHRTVCNLPPSFNHMIAAVPIAVNEMSGSAVLHHPELGSLLLFDPTDERTPFGRLPTDLQGTFWSKARAAS
jgi:hypothetical protein